MSERDGRTITNIARCSLKYAGFPKICMGRMFFTATYLANRTPHSARYTQAPFTVLFGVHVKPDHLRVIGDKAFAHVETHTLKLEDKAWKGRLGDYSMSSKACRTYNSEARRVMESRNIIFIQTPRPTLIDPYTNTTDLHEGSSPRASPADIVITEHDEVLRLLRKLLELSTNAHQPARRHRHLETALRQKHCHPETTRAHRHPKRLLHKCNLCSEQRELLAG